VKLVIEAALFLVVSQALAIVFDFLGLTPQVTIKLLQSNQYECPSTAKA